MFMKKNRLGKKFGKFVVTDWPSKQNNEATNDNHKISQENPKNPSIQPTRKKYSTCETVGFPYFTADIKKKVSSQETTEIT